MRLSIRLLAFMLVVHFAAAAEAREGFGIMKKLATLHRTNPPEIVLPGARLQVAGNGPDAGLKSIADRLAEQLGAELVQHDSRLTLESQKPDVLIEVKILKNSYEDHHEYRQGTQLEPNGKDAKGKQQYREVKVTMDFLVVKHHLEGAYTVQDVRGKKTLLGDSIGFTLNDEYRDGKGAPSAEDMVASDVTRTVEKIVYRLTSTQEAIQVLLPKGSFEDLINLAEASIWNKYAESIEAHPAFGNPEDESYRLYALGLSYEALAYSADSPDMTLRYLEKSAQSYNKSLDLNPKEDYFSKPYSGFFSSLMSGVGGAKRAPAPPPMQRVQQALSKYQTLVSQNEIRATREVESGGKGVTGGAAKAGMTNADVISMLKNGVPQDVVLAAIEKTEDCSFDISPAGLIELTKAKVGREVLKQLQAKSCG